MKELYLPQGKPSLFSRIIGASSLTLMFFSMYYLVRSFIIGHPQFLYVVLTIAGFLFGLFFSMSTNLRFDIINNRFKDEKQIGPIKFGWWQSIAKLDYVSVSGNHNDMFEIKLWMEDNDHFSLGVFYQKEEAMEEGKKIARICHIDLWNATDPKNADWEI